MPRPRRYKTNADRQKAYRERKKRTDALLSTQHREIAVRVMRADAKASS